MRIFLCPLPGRSALISTHSLKDFDSQDLKDYMRQAGEVTYTNCHDKVKTPSPGPARELRNLPAGATWSSTPWSAPLTSLTELNREEEGSLILKNDQNIHENVHRIKLYEEGRGGRSRSRSRSRSPRSLSLKV